MKKLIGLLLGICCIGVLLGGCEKANTITVTDTIKVVSANMTPTKVVTNYVYNGKTMMPVVSTVPPSYNTVVVYKGESYVLTGSGIYDKLSSKQGSYVRCRIKLNEYKDGHYEIVDIDLLD